MRTATLQRHTNETKIDVTVNLDGSGVYDVDTGIGFLDHMLEQLSRHSLCDLTLRCDGDRHIDDHHSTEDTGIAIYKWANGLIGEIVSCFQFHGGDNSIEVYGTQGALIVSGVDLGSRDLTKTYIVPKDSDRGGELVLHDEKEWTISDTVPQFKKNTPEFHKKVASVFVDALVAGDPPPCTYLDGRRASEMIIAAYESARTGKAQKIVYG